VGQVRADAQTVLRIGDGLSRSVEQLSREAASLQAEVFRSRQELSALSVHLQKAKEIERTRIAREVHDDIGGNLTAIKIDLVWLLNRIGKERRASLCQLPGVVMAETAA
jgi:glucose-6-phosphate-specific signal transduction histidine kinase